MTLTVHIPPAVEAHLRAHAIDLDAEAKEAMFVEFYRQDKLSRHQLGLALGISRFEVDAVLKKHDVTEDLPTREELEQDLRAAQSLVSR